MDIKDEKCQKPEPILHPEVEILRSKRDLPGRSGVNPDVSVLSNNPEPSP